MPASPRIVSLLPAATELACVLGLDQQIVGISFECDYPPSITNRPPVVSSAIDTSTMTPAQIDAAVSQFRKEGRDLYVIDEEVLKSLKPDIILSQDLCQVCAPSGKELGQTLDTLDHDVRVLFMSPHTLLDIEQNLRALAAVTDRKDQAETVIANWHRRRWAVEARTEKLSRKPRVSVLEWIDPPYCAGHWLAEMIEVAGGHDNLARRGEDSVRIKWQEVVDWQPEVLVVAPCGYDEAEAAGQMKQLATLPGWDSLPAVRNGRVHAVDADAYFARPGPRVIDGIEILSELFAR